MISNDVQSSNIKRVGWHRMTMFIVQVGVPKRLQPRYRAVMGSIRNAFGPEFLERH